MADLWVTVDPRVASATAGQSVIYDIRYDNDGPATASNVLITTTLPLGLEYVDVNNFYAPGFTCNYSSGPRLLTCSTPSLPSNVVPGWLQLQVTVTLQQSHTLTAYISSDASTTNPPSNNVDSGTLTTVAMNCAVRPTILVTTANIGGGRLRTTVRVANAGSTTDRLERLVFGAFTNAVVDIGGQQGLTGGQTITLGRNEESVVFDVRRIAPGAVTVPFNVIDHCATPWETFVGGGPAAF